MHEENPDDDDCESKDPDRVGMLQMIPFGGTKSHSVEEKKMQEQREEEEELRERGEGDVDGKNAATEEERHIITVSDFHLLLLEPGCRSLFRDSYERKMLMAQQGELKRGDAAFDGPGGRKTSQAELVADMSDSEYRDLHNGSGDGTGKKDRDEEDSHGKGNEDGTQNELDERAVLIAKPVPTHLLPQTRRHIEGLLPQRLKNPNSLQ